LEKSSLKGLAGRSQRKDSGGSQAFPFEKDVCTWKKVASKKSLAGNQEKILMAF
jgi:hypothetical protein